jgi:hypothetical protein
VFFPCGAYTVIVGRDTLETPTIGLPPISLVPVRVNSGPGIGCESGALPGQIGICACPAEGCQTADFACALAHAASKHRTTTRSFIALSPFWPVHAWRYVQPDAIACF